MTTLGHFAENDPEYTFLLTDPDTPRKWQLYLCSEEMLVQLDQFGRGMSRYWNEKGEDVILFDAPERSLAIRNPDGDVWSPAVHPGGDVPAGYRCAYSPACWTVSGENEGCRVTWRIAVPLQTPVEMWTVTLENTTASDIERDVFVYLPVNLMGYCLSKYRFYMATTMFVRAHQQLENNAIWVQSGIPAPSGL